MILKHLVRLCVLLVTLVTSAAVEPVYAAGDCSGSSREPEVGDLNSTSAIGPIVSTVPKHAPVTAHGITITFNGPIGFNASGPLQLADGNITGTFTFGISWTDCSAGKVTVRIENADGTESYQIGDSGSISSPHNNGSINCSGTLSGLKGQGGISSGTDLKDLWVRAYFECTSPSSPKIKIFEAKLMK